MDATSESQELVMSSKLEEDAMTEDAYLTLADGSGDRVVLVEGNDGSSVEEQVLGYLEVQPSQLQAVTEGGTIYLSSEDLDQHLILAGDEGGEFIVVVGSEEEALAALASAEGGLKIQALQQHQKEVQSETDEDGSTTLHLVKEDGTLLQNGISTQDVPQGINLHEGLELVQTEEEVLVEEADENAECHQDGTMLIEEAQQEVDQEDGSKFDHSVLGNMELIQNPELAAMEYEEMPQIASEVIQLTGSETTIIESPMDTVLEATQEDSSDHGELETCESTQIDELEARDILQIDSEVQTEVHYEETIPIDHSVSQEQSQYQETMQTGSMLESQTVIMDSEEVVEMETEIEHNLEVVNTVHFDSENDIIIDSGGEKQLETNQSKVNVSENIVIVHLDSKSELRTDFGIPEQLTYNKISDSVSSETCDASTKIGSAADSSTNSHEVFEKTSSTLLSQCDAQIHDPRNVANTTSPKVQNVEIPDNRHWKKQALAFPIIENIYNSSDVVKDNAKISLTQEKNASGLHLTSSESVPHGLSQLVQAAMNVSKQELPSDISLVPDHQSNLVLEEQKVEEERESKSIAENCYQQVIKENIKNLDETLTISKLSCDIIKEASFSEGLSSQGDLKEAPLITVIEDKDSKSSETADQSSPKVKDAQPDMVVKRTSIIRSPSKITSQSKTLSPSKIQESNVTCVLEEMKKDILLENMDKSTGKMTKTTVIQVNPKDQASLKKAEDLVQRLQEGRREKSESSDVIEPEVSPPPRRSVKSASQGTSEGAAQLSPKAFQKVVSSPLTKVLPDNLDKADVTSIKSQISSKLDLSTVQNLSPGLRMCKPAIVRLSRADDPRRDSSKTHTSPLKMMDKKSNNTQLESISNIEKEVLSSVGSLKTRADFKEKKDLNIYEKFIEKVTLTPLSPTSKATTQSPIIIKAKANTSKIDESLKVQERSEKKNEVPPKQKVKHTLNVVSKESTVTRSGEECEDQISVLDSVDSVKSDEKPITGLVDNMDIPTKISPKVTRNRHKGHHKDIKIVSPGNDVKNQTVITENVNVKNSRGSTKLSDHSIKGKRASTASHITVTTKLNLQPGTVTQDDSKDIKPAVSSLKSKRISSKSQTILNTQVPETQPNIDTKEALVVYEFEDKDDILKVEPPKFSSTRLATSDSKGQLESENILKLESKLDSDMKKELKSAKTPTEKVKGSRTKGQQETAGDIKPKGVQAKITLDDSNSMRTRGSSPKVTKGNLKTKPQIIREENVDSVRSTVTSNIIVNKSESHEPSQNVAELEVKDEKEVEPKVSQSSIMTRRKPSLVSVIIPKVEQELKKDNLSVSTENKAADKNVLEVKKGSKARGTSPLVTASTSKDRKTEVIEEKHIRSKSKESSPLLAKEDKENSVNKRTRGSTPTSVKRLKGKQDVETTAEEVSSVTTRRGSPMLAASKQKGKNVTVTEENVISTKTRGGTSKDSEIKHKSQPKTESEDTQQTIKGKNIQTRGVNRNQEEAVQASTLELKATPSETSDKEAGTDEKLVEPVSGRSTRRKSNLIETKVEPKKKIAENTSEEKNTIEEETESEDTQQTIKEKNIQTRGVNRNQEEAVQASALELKATPSETSNKAAGTDEKLVEPVSGRSTRRKSNLVETKVEPKKKIAENTSEEKNTIEEETLRSSNKKANSSQKNSEETKKNTSERSSEVVQSETIEPSPLRTTRKSTFSDLPEESKQTPLKSSDEAIQTEKPADSGPVRTTRRSGNFFNDSALNEKPIEAGPVRVTRKASSRSSSPKSTQVNSKAVLEEVSSTKLNPDLPLESKDEKLVEKDITEVAVEEQNIKPEALSSPALECKEDSEANPIVGEVDPEILPLHIRLGIDRTYSKASPLTVSPDEELEQGESLEISFQLDHAEDNTEAREQNDKAAEEILDHKTEASQNTDIISEDKTEEDKSEESSSKVLVRSSRLREKASKKGSEEIKTFTPVRRKTDVKETQLEISDTKSATSPLPDSKPSEAALEVASEEHTKEEDTLETPPINRLIDETTSVPSTDSPPIKTKTRAQKSTDKKVETPLGKKTRTKTKSPKASEILPEENSSVKPNDETLSESKTGSEETTSAGELSSAVSQEKLNLTTENTENAVTPILDSNKPIVETENIFDDLPDLDLPSKPPKKSKPGSEKKSTKHKRSSPGDGESIPKRKRVSFSSKTKEKTADQRFDDMMKSTLEQDDKLSSKKSGKRKRLSLGSPKAKKIPRLAPVKIVRKGRRASTDIDNFLTPNDESSDEEVSLNVFRTYSGGKASPSRKTPPHVSPSRPQSSKTQSAKRSKSSSTTKKNSTQVSPMVCTAIQTSPSKNKCQFHICSQGPSPPEMKSPNTVYNCRECHYHTTRIDNIIQHYKECTLMLNQETMRWKEIGDKTPTRFSQEFKPTTSSTQSPSQKGKKAVAKGANTVRKNLSKSLENSSKKKTDNGEDTLTKRNEDAEDGGISDCSDDSDLPTVDFSWKNTFGFVENDIVWVDWKNDQWPALVRKIYPKQKKVSICFIENRVPEKGIKIHARKLSTFDDKVRNKQFLSKGGPNSSKVKAVQKAEDYLRKRFLGMKIRPIEFFNNPEDVRGYLLSAGNSDEEDTHDGQDECPSLMDAFIDPSSDRIEELTAGPADNQDTGFSPSDSLSNEEAERIKLRLSEQNIKLLECIKGGLVENHLIDVFQRQVPSERHEKFNSDLVSVRHQLKQGTWFGPLENEDQRDEVIEYCMSLFTEKIEQMETFDRVAYIFEVWIPEALIKALMLVYSMSASDAEDRFNDCSAWLLSEARHQTAVEVCADPGPLDPLTSKRLKVIEKLKAIGIQDELLPPEPSVSLYRPPSQGSTN